jgi:hypothetical protein
MTDRAARTAPPRKFVAGVVLGVLVAVIMVASPTPALACSCAPAPPPDVALGDAAAVFSGTVVEARIAGSDPFDDLVARIAVDEVWKGDVAATVDVSTAPDSAMCGVWFSEGDRWLVYASTRDDGSLETYLCSRTVPLEYADEGLDAAGEADEDLQALGTGRDPTPGEQLQDGSPFWRSAPDEIGYQKWEPVSGSE